LKRNGGVVVVVVDTARRRATRADAIDRSIMPTPSYYDVNDFLAREYAVSVTFTHGAAGGALGREFGCERRVGGVGDVDDGGVPAETTAKVPLWMLDGDLVDKLEIAAVPECLSEAFWATLEAEDGAKIADLRTINESYFGFGRRFVEVAAKQLEGDADDEDYEEDDDVKRIREGLRRAFEKRWSEILVDACGRVEDARKVERTLTREERVLWDAGRASQVAYEKWRYGREAKTEASKLIQDSKRLKR
jgi:GINS complex subunit 3